MRRPERWKTSLSAPLFEQASPPQPVAHPVAALEKWLMFRSYSWGFQFCGGIVLPLSQGRSLIDPALTPFSFQSFQSPPPLLMARQAASLCFLFWSPARIWVPELEKLGLYSCNCEGKAPNGGQNMVLDYGQIMLLVSGCRGWAINLAGFTWTSGF